jgi:hypothetical protein
LPARGPLTANRAQLAKAERALLKAQGNEVPRDERDQEVADLKAEVARLSADLVTSRDETDALKTLLRETSGSLRRLVSTLGT